MVYHFRKWSFQLKSFLDDISSYYPSIIKYSILVGTTSLYFFWYCTYRPNNQLMSKFLIRLKWWSRDVGRFPDILTCCWYMSWMAEDKVFISDVPPEIGLPHTVDCCAKRGPGGTAVVFARQLGCWWRSKTGFEWSFWIFLDLSQLT